MKKRKPYKPLMCSVCGKVPCMYLMEICDDCSDKIWAERLAAKVIAADPFIWPNDHTHHSTKKYDPHEDRYAFLKFRDKHTSCMSRQHPSKYDPAVCRAEGRR